MKSLNLEKRGLQTLSASISADPDADDSAACIIHLLVFDIESALRLNHVHQIAMTVQDSLIDCDVLPSKQHN